MKYLVDTNVWLEAGLARAHGREAFEFLRKTPALDLAITDFSLNTLGIFLTPKTPHSFLQIIRDIIALGPATVRLEVFGLPEIVDYMQLYGLDFEDGYQYGVAERFDLVIVSFDKHFDRTPRGRKTPAQVLAELRSD